MRLSKETWALAMDTNLLPVHLAAMRTHAGADVVPMAIAPANSRPSRAVTMSPTTVGLL